MVPPIDILHVVSPALADFLVASLWQSVLLTGAVALCLKFVPSVPASARTWLWTAVLALIVLLPAVSLTVPHAAAGAGRAVHLANDWSLGLVCFWAMLSFFRAVQLCLSAAQVWTLARSAEPVAVDAMIAPLLGVGSSKVVLCTSEWVDRPSVVGFFRPRILLSPDLLESLSQPELEQILLHEMEHLRRGDQWTNLLQQVSLVLLPWNPAVFWLNRRLCFERELACDDGVLRTTKARKTYAACLVRLAEDSMLRRGISLTLGALGAFESRVRESELVTRVRRILTMEEPGRASKTMRVATTALLIGALALSVLLARSPQLIDFATVPITYAVTGSSATQTISSTPPMSRAEGARPMLVTAVVSRSNSVRALVKTPTLHKDCAVRHRALRTSQPARMMRTPVWHDEAPMAHPVLALTSVENTQRLYAAIQFQDGWLLIQL